jgi:O-antigen ligase
VRTWTVHLRPGTGPLLVPEAFAWGAALFGPLWLLFHRAWIPAVLTLCAQAAITAVAATGAAGAVAGLALAWLLGLFGQDLRRWSLARRGFVLSHVVAAATADAATMRLYTQRPELAAEGMA